MAVVSQQRIRLGMIGGGEGAFIGAVHRHAAALDGQTELVCGAFSRDADNNQRTGASLGLAPERVYDSWQQLLEQEAALPAQQRMQLLVIVTPNQLHVPISRAAIAAGFHVFCEKPAGVTLAETQQLAVELILLLEQQDLPTETVLTALTIVQRDFQKKLATPVKQAD